VVQREAAVDDIDELARVAVGQEPGLDRLDVPHPVTLDLLDEPREHHGRDVHREHPLADRGGREGELSRARTQLDDRRFRLEGADLLEEADLLRRAGVNLCVVAHGVLLVEVLSACVRTLVEPPRAGVGRHGPDP
jgi:hypothetical protein